MIVVGASVVFGGWNNHHLYARLALASNLAGVFKAYATSTNDDVRKVRTRKPGRAEEVCLLAEKLDSVTEPSSIESGQNLLAAHPMVQRQLGRRVTNVIDCVLVVLGVAAGVAFSEAFGFTNNSPGFHNILPSVTELLVLGPLTVFYFVFSAPGKKSLRRRKIDIATRARQAPTALLESLPFSSPDFGERFHKDAVAAATIAVTDPKSYEAITHISYQGKLPKLGSPC